MDDEIDLRDIFRVLWKNRFLTGGIFMIAILVAVILGFAMPPIYEASGIVALGNFSDHTYTGQGSAKAIMMSEGFLQEVGENLNLSTPWESIKIEPVKGSDNLLSISVETKNKQESKLIVEMIIQLFANRSEGSYNIQRSILSEQLAITQKRRSIVEEDINQTRDALKEMELAPGLSSVEKDFFYSQKINYLRSEELQSLSLRDRCLELQKQLVLLKHIEVVQEAREPVSPVKPQKTQILTIAGMLGLVIGVFASFLREGLGGKGGQNNYGERD